MLMLALLLYRLSEYFERAGFAAVYRDCGYSNGGFLPTELTASNSNLPNRSDPSSMGIDNQSQSSDLPNVTTLPLVRDVAGDGFN